MKRRLHNLLTALSLVLLAAVLVAWVAALRIRVVAAVGWDRREYLFAAGESSLSVGIEVSDDPDLERPLSAVWLTRPRDDPYGGLPPGFGRLRVKNWGGLGVSGGQSWVTRYWFPYWAPTGVFAVVSVGRLVSVLRRRRRARRARRGPPVRRQRSGVSELREQPQ